jgi:hypothetical protein
VSVFDLKAPIFPGSAAAGLYLGQPVRTVLRHVRPLRTEKLSGCKRLRFGTVDLWVQDGRIGQIGLLAGYRGKIGGKVGLGSRLARVDELWGPIRTDPDGNLTATCLPGWCFEFAGREAGSPPPDDLRLKVSEIYVFAALL